MSWPSSPRTRMRPLGPSAPIPSSRRPRASFAGGRRRGPAGGPRGCGRRACPRRARRRARRRSARPRAAAGATSLPSSSPKPPGSRKSRCRSMMSSAVVAGRTRTRTARPRGRPPPVRRSASGPFSERAVYNAVDEVLRWLDAISASIGPTPAQASRIHATIFDTRSKVREPVADVRCGLCTHRCMQTLRSSASRRPGRCSSTSSPPARSCPGSPPAASPTPARRSPRARCASRCARRSGPRSRSRASRPTRPRRSRWPTPASST